MLHCSRRLTGWLAIIGLAVAAVLAIPPTAWGQASPATAAQAESNSSNQLQEVTVTAEYKTERLQDTPIAISVISSTDIEEKGLSSIVDAANLAPNVALSPNPSGYGGVAAIFIRGVGQNSPQFAAEPGVGTYIDDVYYGVLSGAMFSLTDTDRVEVLRGPQGTLSGKNSIGGSIKLFSKQPGPEDDAYAELTYGDFNRVVGRAASSFTLIDGALFGRISAAYKHDDGYVERLDYACETGDQSIPTYNIGRGCKLGTQGGEDVTTARAALRWLPIANLDDTLAFDITEDRSENPAQKTLFQSPIWAGSANYITCPTCYTNYENYVSRPTGPGAPPPYPMPDETPLSQYGVSNHFTYRFSSSLALTSITAYRYSLLNISDSDDGAPASISDQLWNLSHRQRSQELRLNGAVGSLMDWTVGGFYYDGDGTSTGRINIPGGLALGGGGLNLDFQLDDFVVTLSRSAFLHTVWHLTEKADFTAAVRYTKDSKEFTFNRLDVYGNPYARIPLFDLPVDFRGTRTDYRGNLDYRWTSDFMTYAEVATGYKGGGVNPQPFYATQAVPYNPETLTSYEVGAKSAWFDRRLTANVAAFYNVYRDFQATVTSCPLLSPFPTAPCGQITNVGDADIKGVEIESALNPVGGLHFDVSAGYLDFKYTSVLATSGITLHMTNIYTPKDNVNAGVAYEFNLGSAGTITPRFDYNYRASMQANAVNSPSATIPSRGLANAAIAWHNPQARWSVTVAVTNLTDKFYYQSIFDSSRPPYFVATGNPGRPREVMATVKRTFE